MAAVLLAFGACLAWGGSDFLAGRATRERSLLFILAGSQVCGLAAALTVVVALAPALPPLGGAVTAGAAGLAELAGFAALYRALAHGPMSLVAPLSAIGGVVPLTFGIATGDRLGTIAALSLALAVAGTALAASGERDDARGASLGLLLAGAAALAFGVFFVLLAEASDAGGAAWAVLVNRAVSTAVAVSLLVIFARRRGVAIPRVTRESLGLLASIGLLDIAANALYATASGHERASVVGVIGSLYPMATALLAVIVLRERPAWAQAAGVLTTLTAVGLVGATGV